LKLRILHVEDNPNDQLILKHSLENNLPLDFDLTTVGTGKEGLDEIEKKKFDLIVLDYMLPAMTGIEFLNELQKRQIQTPIIFVTSKGSEKIAVEAMKFGVLDYIVKDEISSNRLTESIREIITKSSLPDEVDMETAKQIAALFAESSIIQTDVVETLNSEPKSQIPSEKLVSVLKKMVEVGILKAKPSRSVVACPSCGSLTASLRLQCPECGDVQLKKGESLEHLTCGHIDFDSMFEKGDGELVCPKCEKKLKMIGVDYRRIKSWYKCSQNHFFGQPVAGFICSFCKKDFTLENARLEMLQEYQLTEKGSDMLRLGLLGTGMTEKSEKSEEIMT
jgi:CheY-like chemotaxis protein